jgi:hypothetical protein
MRPIKSLLVLVFARAFGNAVSAVRPWDRGWRSSGRNRRLWDNPLPEAKNPGLLAKIELRIPFQWPIRFLPETDYPRASRSFPRIAGSGNEIGDEVAIIFVFVKWKHHMNSFWRHILIHVLLANCVCEYSQFYDQKFCKNRSIIKIQ